MFTIQWLFTSLFCLCVTSILFHGILPWIMHMFGKSVQHYSYRPPPPPISTTATFRMRASLPSLPLSESCRPVVSHELSPEAVPTLRAFWRWINCMHDRVVGPAQRYQWPWTEEAGWTQAEVGVGDRGKQNKLPLWAFGAAARRFVNASSPYPGWLFNRSFHSASDRVSVGIVTVAGGTKYLPGAYVSIRLIREQLRSELPIEIWHTEAERPPTSFQAFLQSSNLTDERNDQNGAANIILRCFEEILGVDMTTAAAVATAGGRRKRKFSGFALKILAMVFSSFEHLFYLDADNHSVGSIEPLFQSPEFAQTGLLLWPDLWVYEPLHFKAFWDVMGQKGTDTTALAAEAQTSHESGQVLIDKIRMWPALMMALVWTFHAQVFFHITVPNGIGVGDKEFLPLACRVLNLPYSLIKTPPSACGGSAFVPMEIGFTAFRFQVLATRAPIREVELAELVLLTRDGKRVSPSVGPPHVYGAMPNPHHPARNAFDGNPLTTWAQFNLSSASHLPSLILLFSTPPLITKYLWISAPNASSSSLTGRKRDPVSWLLFGKYRGSKEWKLVHAVCDYPTPKEGNAKIGPFSIGESQNYSCFADDPIGSPTTTIGHSSNNNSREANPSLFVLSAQHRTELMEARQPKFLRPVQIAHTQVQHGPDGGILFIHSNCHKVTMEWVDLQSPASHLDHLRSWRFLAWHNVSMRPTRRPSKDLLLTDRAIPYRSGLGLRRGQRECRFHLVNPDVVVPFVSMMPFDVEMKVRSYLMELKREPSFQEYRAIEQQQKQHGTT